MTRSMQLLRATMLGGLAALLALPGCAEGADGFGGLRLGLREGADGWFRLRIYEDAPNEELEGSVLFNTGCIDARSRTYELTNIPAGTGRWVVIESFGSEVCTPESRSELGFRGNVDIPEGTANPYYHVPLYESGGVTPLPEGINISAALAEEIDFCDPASDTACAAEYGDTFGCYDAQKPTYWCVPTCSQNSDCAEFHPRAICQAGTNWCVLNSPYPLNLSEPRAMGFATTTSAGDPVFVGGFGRISSGRLLAADGAVERFDARIGLFEKVAVAGLDGWGAGLSGYAALGDDRVVAVGGVRSAGLTWSGTGDAFSISLGNLADEDCSGAACVDNLLASIAVIDLAGETADVAAFPMPIANPTVVRLSADRVLVAGGWTLNTAGDAITGTDKAFLCDVTPGGAPSCEPAGTMTTPRSGADGMCLDAGCTEVLIFGGNGAGSLAEKATIDPAGAAFAALGGGAGIAPIRSPVLCGDMLVGGSSVFGEPGGVAPAVVSVDGTTLTTTPASGSAVPEVPLWGAAAPMADGSCWVAGGLNPNGRPSVQVFQASDGAISARTFDLNRGRFGAMATTVTAGPLTGAVLFGGGLTLAGPAGGPGGVDVVRGVEVLLP